MLNQVTSDMERVGAKQQLPDLKVYDQKTEIKEMDIEEVEKKISSYGINHLVLTGGEPMLQQIALASLLKRLKQRVKPLFVEMETSGTVKPIQEIMPLIDQWNVSPKLEYSGNIRETREKAGCLQFFSRLPETFFKFVIHDPRDVIEVEELVRRYSIDPSKVLLMPEGLNSSVLQERSTWLSKICKDRGYRLATRLHILLWGNVRGT